MTPRPPAVVAAALTVAAAAGAYLGAPAAAHALVGAPPRAAAATASDDVRLLRSDPPDGAWEQTAPARVRLWFAGGAGRTATAKVSTPGRPGMRSATVTWTDGVLSVRVPQDGAGEYRVLWFLVAPGGTGSSAAGTLTYRVGSGAPAGRSKAFTIPASPTGTAADLLSGDGSPTTSAPLGRKGPAARTSSATSSAAAGAATGAASPSRSRAAVVPDAPADDGGTPVWRRGVRLPSPSPAGLLATVAAGLAAVGLGAGWSLRVGARAATRPR